MGSIRTVTGMPFAMSVSAASRRLGGEGAYGSMVLAVSLLRVVMVNDTMEGTLRSRSVSLVTRFDFVMICILQLVCVRVCRLLRVKASFASCGGYGSELFEIDISSPLSLNVSCLSLLMRSFLGLHVWKCGM